VMALIFGSWVWAEHRIPNSGRSDVRKRIECVGTIFQSIASGWEKRSVKKTGEKDGVCVSPRRYVSMTCSTMDAGMIRLHHFSPIRLRHIGSRCRYSYRQPN
jgi:hypothetical protein